MNTYNYLAGVTQKEGAKMNDGTILDASTYSQGLTVLLTTNGQFLYCLEHGKGVHNGDEYNSQNSLTMIKEAQKNTAISASQKQQLIARVLSIAPQNINVDYNNSGSLKGVKGNTYQWMAAQIIVWEIMVGERNADGSYRGVTTSGATSVSVSYTHLNDFKNERKFSFKTFFFSFGWSRKDRMYFYLSKRSKEYKGCFNLS